MYIVTAEEMRELDRLTIEHIGIPALVLMENAGREAAKEIIRYDQILNKRNERKGHWIVLTGKGNNGGDGLVVARHLIERGLSVTIVFTCPFAELSQDAAVQQNIVSKLGIASMTYPQDKIDWQKYDGIVDALLGTGSNNAPREPYASLIREANASQLPIIALDIPSGLNSDNGTVYEPCIRAAVTVTLGFAKCGLTQYPGAELAGDVIVKPIGILPQLAEQLPIRTFTLDDACLQQRLQIKNPLPRKNNTHKGTFGHVLLVAGSLQMSGAGMLCAKAAMRTGCGLVTWALPERLAEPMIGKIPEVMLASVQRQSEQWNFDDPTDSHSADCKRKAGDWSFTDVQQVIEYAKHKSALIVGPGMGRFHNDGPWLRQLWEQTSCPLVVDADALNIIADAADFTGWQRRTGAVILTPHPGEMARLSGLSVHEVQHDRIGLARRYAAQHEVTLVLKGARTVVATPQGVVYVNTTGNPGMATGGAGDVLAGVIASLLAQGLDADRAAALGVYLHGAAGDRASAKRQNPGSIIAGDIIEEL